MSNPHHAKLADVWKHLALAEILSIERPQRYWESHAGNARYSLLVDDRERRYGALHFLDVAGQHPALARSRYLHHLEELIAPPTRVPVYPGSPLLAMRELGPDCSYLFCDTDPHSVADLTRSAVERGLDSQVEVVAGDGMTALHQALAATENLGTVLAHVDPFEPGAPGPSKLSAIDVARELVDRGVGVVYWYGYDRPDLRAWAVDAIAAGTSGRPLWHGDILVTSTWGTRAGGYGVLGRATTPGTGCGIVCANLSDRSLAACQQLGEELSAAYDGVQLPNLLPGRLHFACSG